MSTGNVELEGLGELLKRVDIIGPNLASCVRTAQWQLGGKMLMQAKNNARSAFTGTPSGDPEPGTPTGRLMGSLSMRSNFTSRMSGFKAPAKSGDEIKAPPASEANQTVVVGTNVEYAQYPEFGTRKMQARMYLYPAFFAFENDFEETLERVIYKKKALTNFNHLLPIFDPAGAED